MLKRELEDDEKLFYAKIDDKIKLSKTRNKIVYTDFLYETEISKAEKYLKLIKFDKYIFSGGYSESERKALIIYPEKLTEEMAIKNLENIFSIIRIILPNNLKETYLHKDFLGGIMKLGVSRDKIGDIIIDKDGADIVVFKENELYFSENLKLLTRFRKSNIDIVNIKDVKKKQEKFEEKQIIVSSMRLDSIVSELANTSRNKAIELIEIGRVLVNHEEIFKPSKSIKIKDIITIRGKGKFIIDSIIRNTKNDRLVIKVMKYS